jgi:geranylgeranyl reductase family protein
VTGGAEWDLVVIGAGPAGTAAALGALHRRPDLSVLLVDRAAFPRDKACGDGIAPHVLDLLASVGVTGLLDDRVPVRRLRLERDGEAVVRDMRRPGLVVPREVLDARLLHEARRAGAVFAVRRVREVVEEDGGVTVDGTLRARAVVGADGARSRLRATLGIDHATTALALRGYAPTPAARRGEQVIVFGTSRQPSYAWSFDRGDGCANVGYGEALRRDCGTPSRQLLLDRLEELLPGATTGGASWRGHHLPLSGSRWAHPRGRVLLAGDAAGLVNPLTGEGIYYAVATGLLAGRCAAEAVAGGMAPGPSYHRAVRRLIGSHLRHTAAAAKLATAGPVLSAGIRAAAGDQQVFDDLVELGLGRGRITGSVVRGLLRAASDGALHGREGGRLSR